MRTLAFFARAITRSSVDSLLISTPSVRMTRARGLMGEAASRVVAGTIALGPPQRDREADGEEQAFLVFITVFPLDVVLWIELDLIRNGGGFLAEDRHAGKEKHACGNQEKDSHSCLTSRLFTFRARAGPRGRET